MNDLEACLVEARESWFRHQVGLGMNCGDAEETRDCTALSEHVQVLREEIKEELEAYTDISLRALNGLDVTRTPAFLRNDINYIRRTRDAALRTQDHVMAYVMQRELLIYHGKTWLPGEEQTKYHEEFETYVGMHLEVLKSLKWLNLTEYPLTPVLHDLTLLRPLHRGLRYETCRQYMVQHAGESKSSGANLLHVLAELVPETEAAGFHHIPNNILKDRSVLMAKDIFGRTPLHITCATGNSWLATTLVAAGAESRVTDASGLSPFQYSVIYKRHKIAKMLLNADANVNENFPYLGRKALHIATDQSDLKMVQILLDYQARIDAVDFNGKTALHIAAEKGSVRLLGCLVRNGADVNATVIGTKDTALHLAASAGNCNTVLFLVRNGANQSLHDAYGRLPISLATGEAVRAFREWGFDGYMGIDMLPKDYIYQDDEPNFMMGFPE